MTDPDRDTPTNPEGLRPVFELPARKEYAPPPAEPTLLDVLMAVRAIREDVLEHADRCALAMVEHLENVIVSELAATKANSARLAKGIHNSIDAVLDTNHRVRVMPPIFSRKLRELADEIDQTHREIDARANGHARTDAE